VLTVCWKTVEVVAGVFTAVGTVAVAVLAIWGDFFRYKFAGPQLGLSLNDSRGDLTPRANQTQAYFFHLKIRNRRLWSPAKDVRVLLERIARRGPDGSFFAEALVYPLPLAWTPSELGDFQRTITDTETCDLGFLDQNADRFRLSTLIIPNKLQGWVRAGEAIHIRIVASGQNATSSKPLFLEIAWDGVWTTDRDEMQKHLVVKEITAL
jgi:hypothetical protein